MRKVVVSLFLMLKVVSSAGNDENIVYGYEKFENQLLWIPQSAENADYNIGRMVIDSGDVWECIDQCDRLPKCKHFNWNKEKQECWFKSVQHGDGHGRWSVNTKFDSYQKEPSVVIPYTKFERRQLRLPHNADNAAYAIGNLAVPDGDVTKCQRWCTRVIECKLFNFEKAKNRCWFKAVRHDDGHGQWLAMDNFDVYEKGCPTGEDSNYQEFQGRCLRLYGFAAWTYNEAKLICKEEGSSLVMAKTKESLDQLLGFIDKVFSEKPYLIMEDNRDVWINAKKNSRYGDFTWADGSRVADELWVDNFPDKTALGTDCAYINADTGARGLENQSCFITVLANHICEI